MGSSSEGDAELRTKVRQQEVVADLGQLALRTDDVDRVLREATAAVADVLDTEYCAVWERQSSGELRCRAGVGFPDDVVGSATVPADADSQVAATLRTEEPVLFEDLADEDLVARERLLAGPDAESGISVLVGSVGAPWGVLEAHATEQRSFTDRDADFLRSVANVLGSAIENDRTRRDAELFRRLLDESTDAVVVIDPETGAFVDVNDTACRRLGYSREELLERTVPDVEVDLPDLDAWRAHVEEVRSAGDVTFEGRHRRADGSTFPVEVNVTLVDLDREYAVAIVRDVSERWDRERELEEYRALTEAANDAIVTIDESSTIRTVNPAVEDVFGLDPEAIAGEPLTVLMPDRFVEQHYEALERYLETGERHLDWDYIELPGQHSDGSEVPLAISFSEVEFGGEQFFTGVMRDVTERKEYERKLEASNERLEQFAYAASHDLQEPLRMISSYLRLIERRSADALDEDAREFLAYAVDGADRMRDMIDGLLEYSRVETRGDPFEPVDLDDVVADVRDDLQVRIGETDADLTVEELPTVEGDAGQLRQVFQNLLDNALEYSGDDRPRIHVSAERADSAAGRSDGLGDAWRVAVRDEGVGIEPDDADRVFEVFQRLHAREEHEGTGIGLALAKRIVERHGGEIWVDSTPGEGATFYFTLPAADEPA